jgi:hypothetical protein
MKDGEVKAMLERQAAWQRARASLPWAEKLRMSAAMRESLLALRKAPRLDEPKGRTPGEEGSPGADRAGLRKSVD